MDCCYSRIERKIVNACEWYGRVISRNPVPAIIFAVLLNGLLGINLKWIQTENDVTSLYMPSSGQAAANSQKMKSTFPNNGNYFLHQLTDDATYGTIIFTASKNIINESYKAEISKIHQTVLKLKVSSTSSSYSFEEICAKSNETCLVPGSLYLDDNFWLQYTKGSIAYPEMEVPISGIERIDDIFGKVEMEGGILKAAMALRMTYYLRHDTDEDVTKSLAWEQEFEKELSGLKTNMTTIVFSTSQSLSSEVMKDAIWDTPWFILILIVMTTFAFLFTSNANCLTFRGHLGIASVLASALSILGGFGLCSAADVKYVSLAGLVPFFILGVGVHSMFMLLSGLNDAPLRDSIETRISFTMKKTGVSISVACITDVIALLLGLMSDMTGIRNLCVYTGSSVFLCYVNHVTFFLACVVFHEHRVASTRHCLTCKIAYSKEEMRHSGYRNKLALTCCSGQPPSRKEDHLSLSENVHVHSLPKALLTIPSKVVIILVYLCFLGVAIWGFQNVEQGLKQTYFVPDDSFYSKYSVIQEEHFPKHIPVSFVVDDTMDYRNPTVHENVNKLIKSAKQSSYIDDSYEINWLKEYLSLGFPLNVTKEEFGIQIRKFTERRPLFKNDIAFNKNRSQIIHTRMYVMTNNIDSPYKQGLLLQEMRKIVEESPINVYSYGSEFVHFQQNEYIVEKSLQTVGIAFAACVVVTCFFMPHVLLVLIVALSLASIIIGVIGYMSFWALPINSVTMVYLTISVGFSVNFCTFVCSSFMLSDGSGRSALTNAVIMRTSGPILSSVISTFIGICILLMANSKVFSSFFKTMFLSVIISGLHCIFVLPVILSLIGPLKRGNSQQRKTSSRILLFPNQSSATWSIASGGVNALNFHMGKSGQFGNKI